MSEQSTSKNILVVDDEKLIANALVIKLSDAGFQAKALFNGEDVLSELKQIKYDLVLLDLLMPVTDGWTVLEQIKNMGVKTIITSNLSQEEDKQRAKDLGAIDFMVKSDVSLTQIIDRVKEVVKVV